MLCVFGLHPAEQVIDPIQDCKPLIVYTSNAQTIPRIFAYIRG